ncbi:MAG: Cd(II)/Pb(II)-responsive transcriptional regulator [Burkholderiaceae bacterium]
MQIGQLASAAGTNVETVRYYEKAGLLPEPGRSTGNFRQYTSAHLERLRFIRNCRALNMSHDEIRELLRLADHPGDGCDAVNALLDAHIEHVDARIRELAALREQLRELRDRCAGGSTTGNCAILHELAVMETEAPSGRPTHLG